MARNSLRQLVASLFPATPRTTPNRKTRRANRWQAIEQLEDRTTPAIGISLNAPFNSPFLAKEGQTFTVTGTLFDSTPTTDPNDLQLEAIVPPENTSVTNVTYLPASGGTFNTRSFSFALNIIDGIDNSTSPLQSPFTLLGKDGTGDSSTPVTVRPQLQNVAPELTGGGDQVARAGVATNLSLGMFSDPGVNDSPWTVAYTITPQGGTASSSSFTTASQGAISLPYTFSAAGTYTVTETVTDKDSAPSDPMTFTVTVSAATIGTSYVVAAFAGYANGTVVDRDNDPTNGQQNGTIGADTFATITDALAATNAGGTVNVAAGTYAPISVTKSVKLLGPNADISAAGTAARNTEAVIQAISNSPTEALVKVTGDNVTLKGFRLDGYNSNNTTLGGNYGLTYSGAKASATYGIINGSFNSPVLINNLTVSNNAISNTAIGVLLKGTSSTTPPATGSIISNNSFTDIGNRDFGYGVSIRKGFYADITDNTMERVYSGIQTSDGFDAAQPAARWNWTGNSISAYAGGIMLNQFGGAATPNNVSSNTITQATLGADGSFKPAPTNSYGVLASGTGNVVNLSLNSISGFDYGVIASSNTNTTITGSSTKQITNTKKVGVWATNNIGWSLSDNPVSNTAIGLINSPTLVTLNGVQIVDATGEGIRVAADTSNTTTNNRVVVTLTGNTSIAAPTTGTTTGLAIDGPAKLGNNTLGNTAFSGFTGTSQFVVLSNGAYGTGTIAQKTITGTGASYNGVLGRDLATTSTPTGFAVEDKITHYLDNATLGFVRTTANQTFVTQSSGSIQRGINVSAAPVGSATTGDTVYVQGGATPYAEAVTVNVAGLQLLGANAGITAGKGFVTNTRGAESVLTTAAGSNVVTVQADNVLVDGFTISGSGGAAVGISSDDSDGTDLANNIYTGLKNTGVDFYKGSGTVRGSKFTDNPSGGVNGDSFGLLAFFSAPNFTGNAVDTTGFGAFYQYTPAGTSLDVSGNVISARQLALGFGETDGAIAITVNNNTLSVSDPAGTGVQVTNQFQTLPIMITDTNTITYDGTGTSTGSGLFVFNSGAPVNFAGTVIGFATGVDATNVVPDGFGFPVGTLQTTAVTLNGATLTDNATGVRVTGQTGNDPTSTGETVTVGLSAGTTITGGTTGLLLDGPQAKVANNALGSVAFTGQSGDYIMLANGAYNAAANSGTVLDARAATFGTATPSGLNPATPADLQALFVISGKITDQLDDASLGFVQLQANTAFVTAANASGAIQRGIDAEGILQSDGTVYVQAGSYTEDVVMAASLTQRVGLRLQGEGAATTTLYGAVGGPTNVTLQIGQGQTVDGFTITRFEARTATDESPIGVVNVSGATQYTVSNNVISNHRTGIYVNGGSAGTYTRNTVTANRSGFVFPDPTYGAVQVTQNFVTNNTVFGFYFDGVTTVASGFRITNNSISGNVASGIENDSTAAIDAAGNWFGTTTPTVYDGNVVSKVVGLSGPADQYSYPTSYPAYRYAVSGTGLGNTDFTPFLLTGTDISTDNGFQGDFAILGVTAEGGQIQSGERINEAIAYNNGSATKVHVLAGTYGEAVNVDRVIDLLIEGNASFGSLAGTEAGATVDLQGRTLTVGGDNTSTTFNGVFVGETNSQLVKIGAGVFTLAGNNLAYAGTTAINAGTLALNGASMALPADGKLGGNVSVASGATLALGGEISNLNPTVGGNISNSGTLTGSGTIVGSLTNNGVVAPGGDGLGVITVGGNFEQTNGGSLAIDIDIDSPNSTDNLTVTGTVTLGGTVTFTSLATTSAVMDFDSFQFITNDDSDAVSGEFTSFPANTVVMIDGRNFIVNYAGGTGNDVVLLVVPANFGAVPSAVVDDDYASLTGGTQVTADDGSVRTVGYDAFGTLQQAIDSLLVSAAVTPSLRLSGGTYGSATIDRKVAITLQADTNNPDGTTKTPETTVTVDSLTDTSGLASVALNKMTFAVGSGTLAGPISGSGSFIKVDDGTAGGGTLIVSGTNTFAGYMKITGGTFRAGADEVIPDFVPVTVTAGTLNLKDHSETIGSLAGAGSVNLDNAELRAGRLGTNTTFAGGMSGSGQFVKVGGGTLTLTGANTYAGGTVIEAGTLQLGTGGSIAGNVDTTGGGSLAFNQSGPVNFTQVITGDGGVIQNGTGTLTLTGANTYTGGTVVNKGTLVIDTATHLGSGPITANGNAKVSVEGTVASSATFNLNGGATLSVAGTKTLTLTGAQVNGGALIGPGSVVAKTGTAFAGVTIAADTTVTVSGASTEFTNIVNNGKFIVATGVTGATLSTFTNASNGRVTVSGAANVSNFASTGLVEVLSGGLLKNTGTADLVFGGGSITRLGAATVKGGTIDLGDADMKVSAGIVSNNGVIQGAPVVGMPPLPTSLLVLDNNSVLFLSNGDFNDVQAVAINGSTPDMTGFAS